MPGKVFEFAVVDSPREIPSNARNRAFLITDDWDDWFKYSTMYTLIVCTGSGERIPLGYVKIGQLNMEAGQRRPALEARFESLSDDFFSLGQSEDYYEGLGKLDDALRDTIVRGLRDLVGDPDLWDRAKREDVTRVSLTRSVSSKSIKGQFRRLLDGGLRLTPYAFSYAPPKRRVGKELAETLSFKVTPESNPPTNVHVLIGRNGVGKTRMLDLMTKSLAAEPRVAGQAGKFTVQDDFDDSPIPFASIVTVSFSAFDEVELLPEKRDTTDPVRYYYIGLRRNQPNSKWHGRPKTPERLAKEFVDAMGACLAGPRSRRWRKALEMLEADPIFKEAEVVGLAASSNTDTVGERATRLFQRLSSGHKIVLLTISRLVESVEEKTLVLIDEPEAHLHPPLLSAFVRSLSDLLVNRNGVSIIATHSPVVLQEVPQTCVWMMRRSGEEAVAERPECETFGENVGVLTREVFRLEVAQTGFHSMLAKEVAEGRTFEQIVDRFSGELGAEARAILRGLVAARDRKEG